MLLYHYTSLETFFKIFNTKEKKITFWATNAYYMNDPKEIEYSFKLFIDSLEFFEKETNIKDNKLSDFFKKTDMHNELFKMFGDPFLISFSESFDDLSMWRFYGKNGDGVSIGIDREYLIEFSKTNESPNTNLIKCIYEEEKLLKELKLFWINNYSYFPSNLSEKTLSHQNENLIFLIQKIAFIAKQNSYLPEKEWRLCKSEVNKKNMNFTFKNNVLLPYIKLEFDREAVKEIVLGPCLNNELTKKSMDIFLENNNFNNLKNNIIKSKFHIDRFNLFIFTLFFRNLLLNKRIFFLHIARKTFI